MFREIVTLGADLTSQKAVAELPLLARLDTFPFWFNVVPPNPSVTTRSEAPMRTVSPPRLGVLLCALVTALMAVAPPARGCALERDLLPSSLSLQHPRSVDVAFAMHDAIERGELKLDPAPSNAFTLLKVRSRLQQLRAALAKGGITSEVATNGAFAIVLIEYGLWSRFRIEPDGGLAMQFHIDGPAKDEIVMVTGDVVLEALLDGRLPARQAIEQRLIVLDDAGAAVGTQLGRAFPPRDREDAVRH
jgi:hypothetical protein